ncbi:hypothetical protein KDA_29020 [Dictyobacter alpinus]|uniref:Uncharacterized protein n=1 Tax=Dictyobacter alpinus TaxID=2014873 RepID=A0A402B7U3_9CHLR|nr:hypothetical protein [Dictyobacter alpinus]GCE27418.1 hypothetical protein KDA_29020 [Dictyobacter alpinus]
MSNYPLPAHEFFIYVPAKNKQQSSSYVLPVELKTGETTSGTPENADVPAALQTWTKIQLADTLNIYACLQSEEHPTAAVR